ncbi:VUT family protein, partial [Piscirickettsia salmonis]
TPWLAAGAIKVIGKHLKKEVHISAISLLMAYMAVKLTCNILFFYHIQLNLGGATLKLTYSAILYPLVYVLMDWMVICYGTIWTMFLILFGVLLDGFSSGMISSTQFITIPHSLGSNELMLTQSVHNLSQGIWSLYWHGLAGSIIAYISELLLFSWLYNRLFNKSFWLSSIASICTTLAIHNAICDYQMFAGSPDRLDLILSNYGVNLIVIIAYTTFISVLRKKFNSSASNQLS